MSIPNFHWFPMATGSGIQDWKPCFMSRLQFFHMTQPSKKLSDKFLGPYESLHFLAPIQSLSDFQTVLHAVNLVFHISMLEPATPKSESQLCSTPPLPIMSMDQPEFEVSEILDSKIDNWHHACKLFYLVCWTGYEGTDCYDWVHCTTQPEVGFQRGFGQWLQLMCCTNLLLWYWVFLESMSTSSELNQNWA